jgi:hypothetical protein
MEIGHQSEGVGNPIEQSAKHYGRRATEEKQAERPDQAKHSIDDPTRSQGLELSAWAQ